MKNQGEESGKKVLAVPSAPGTPPETATAERLASLPTYDFTLEEMTHLGPDLDNLKISSKGMAFAGAYLGFWEMHKAFFEAIRAGQLKDGTKQIMKIAEERAKNRFGKMHNMNPKDVTHENFYGYLFITAFIHGRNLFIAWTKTPEGEREMIREAGIAQLSAIVGGIHQDSTRISDQP